MGIKSLKEILFVLIDNREKKLVFTPEMPVEGAFCDSQVVRDMLD